jgi:hypothetical protein
MQPSNTAQIHEPLFTAISNYLILLLVAGIDTLFAKISTGKYVSGSL